MELRPWTFDGKRAFCLASPHYLVYTTILDQQFLTHIGQLVEGALGEYGRLGADVPISDRPMVCYLFENRAQWATFTRSHTGGDSQVYLQISRGGYTVGDWYVAYYLGDLGTYSVTAHEGFHQYVARNMRKRIPPFLEEGLACMFEDVQWESGLPRWDLTTNVGRQTALRSAVDHSMLLPLGTLISMHAGQIVSQTREHVAAFYAQCWAFAEFLWEADGARYRPALQKMLADAAAGNLWGESFTRAGVELLWNPRSARPLLEHYLGMDLPAIDRAYQHYIARRCGREES